MMLDSNDSAGKYDFFLIDLSLPGHTLACQRCYQVQYQQECCEARYSVVAVFENYDDVLA